MQSNIEILNNLERKITIKAPSDEIDLEMDKRLKEMATKYRIPGFRPGKAPVHLMRDRYGKSLREDIVNEVIDNTLRKAFTEQNVMPASMPQIKLITNKKGEPLEYEAIFEVFPQLELQSLENVEIENISVDITQKDVDSMIHKLRHQAAKWVDADRLSRKGDRVMASFEGRQNGEAFEGGSAKNVPIELGSGMAIPGFEEAFINHKAGDSIEVELTFPAEYHNKALAGKPVHFTGEIHKVMAPELPPLDDAFAQQFGVKEGGIEQLRQSVLENMQRDIQQKVRGHLKGQVLEKLLALHPTELPNALVTRELQTLLQQEKHYTAQLPEERKPDPKAERPELIKLAKQRISLGLIFGELIRKYKIEADPARIETLLREITEAYNYPESVMEQYRSDKRLLRQLEESAIEDQAIDEVIKQAKVVDKIMTYNEFKGFKPAQEDLTHA